MTQKEFNAVMVLVIIIGILATIIALKGWNIWLIYSRNYCRSNPNFRIVMLVGRIIIMDGQK